MLNTNDKTKLNALIKKIEYAINFLDDKYNFDIQELQDINILINDIKEIK